MTKIIKQTFHTNILRLLAPVVRAVVKSGVTYKEFCLLSKATYIETVSKDYGIRGRPTNTSRISLITGIDRKEIKRIKNRLETDTLLDESEKFDNRLTQILEAWHSTPQYVDENFLPKALTLEGNSPSFLSLAKIFGGDVPLHAIYKELLLGGAIELQENGLIRPLTTRFLPKNSKPYDTKEFYNALDALNALLDFQESSVKHTALQSKNAADTSSN
jgi:hypothetical protein